MDWSSRIFDIIKLGMAGMIMTPKLDYHIQLSGKLPYDRPSPKPEWNCMNSHLIYSNKCSDRHLQSYTNHAMIMPQSEAASFIPNNRTR